MPCPVGAGRMRAPFAVAANGGSAMRHWRDEANIRLRGLIVNLIRAIDTMATIAQLPDRAARRRRQCPEARPSAGSKRSGEH
jgi:hypothetical protein